jgi:hypothetical protein
MWVMNKLMIMTNTNITLEYERRGPNEFRFPADDDGVVILVVAATFVTAADVVALIAGQVPFIGEVPGTVLITEVDTGSPPPGSITEYLLPSTVIFSIRDTSNSSWTNSKVELKLTGPGQVTLLLQWIVLISSGLVQVKRFCDCRAGQDGPPQVTIT